jgi:DNA polymerase III subunit delta
MKIGAGEVLRSYARPDPKRMGLLIWGADAMRVAMKRQEVIAAVIGPEGEAEMRLARLSGADLRRDPAALSDAVRAQGFFPGARVAFVEEATDGLAPLLGEVMADWRAGDAVLVVTAGSLASKSALRKLFEAHPAAHALALYDDPPGRDEIEAALTKAGLTGLGREAMADITALAQVLDPGDFRQTLEKIGLYKLGDATPLSSADVAACAPATVEAEVDEIITAAALGRTSEIGPLMRRLDGQGVGAVKLCMDATRHFRTLHLAAADPGGAASGLARARPPVMGPRRDVMLRQAQGMGLYKIEEALRMLVDTDLTLRSASRAPAMALMERTLIRLSQLVVRR